MCQLLIGTSCFRICQNLAMSGTEIAIANATRSSDPGQPTESGNSDLDSTDLVLKNINMSIMPGEKIAICGRSGR
jgi:ABC-type multidrug transport system fused ATPase/permease subunit